ncbi:MAG: rRNA pseudouridine synthase [Holosporales bacterium]|jgi:23S rRNA pseudouridine2605 synthase|nr:rRNA pseudouridine synthase [Holosporales bacterium]
MKVIVRLNKAMAMLGICSRREADKMISSGHVYVNGELVSIMGSTVLENDVITVHGKNHIFGGEGDARIWIYHKPLGLITTHNDTCGRRTVFDDVRTKIKERVVSVGRLDINSEGLLLLTNSGDFARYAESPRTGWERRYKVRLFGTLTQGIISELEMGTTINGVHYAPINVRILKQSEGKNTWVDCTLREGKNREIRNLFGNFGLQVNRLLRYQYGPYLLKNLRPGELRSGQIPDEYQDRKFHKKEKF